MSVEKNADFAEQVKIVGLKSTINIDNTKQATHQTEYASQIYTSPEPPSFTDK